jgi:hypothetical protein
MRLITVIFIVGVVSFPAAAASPANVIAAAATSSAPQAASVICLLEPGCPSAWSPGSADTGANEGIYVQFESAVDADAVELDTNVKSTKAPFTLSVNGVLAARTPSKREPAESNTSKFVARYAVSGSTVKSIFFRLGVQKGGWRGFSLSAIRFLKQGKSVDLELPLLVPAAVAATSVLDPAVAYQPANLFDSRYDFAWSTNGKNTSGKGESVQVTLGEPQNLTGLIVWNGYQRSQEHFKANGRVTKIRIEDGQTSQSVALADRMGGQRISFGNPLKTVSSLKLTIEDVAVGTKYPDVLISELRLIDDHDQILVPQVKGMVPEGNPRSARLIDRSLSSAVCSSSISPGNFQRSLRIRADGSFVIYGKAYEDESGKKTDQVLEGNWEQRGSTIRIFGKRYSDTVVRTEYSQAAQRTPASIFQSDLKIARFGDLTATEQHQLAALILTRISGDAKATVGKPITIRGVGNQVLAKGSDEKSLAEELAKNLSNMNPWTVSSPILADAMLPSDDIGSCETSF